jgi:GH15 family glucan-1,4-alpha-glucosidase
MRQPKISDYALIGDSCSAALVSNQGSIDWCCLPEFHSPSIFAKVLDEKKGGYFSISPVGKYTSHHNYIPDTNVVETFFETETGTVRLLDAYSVRHEEDKKNALYPQHEILRIVEAISGTVLMRMEYSPRFYYGKVTPTLQNRERFGIHYCSHDHIFTLISSLEPDHIHLSGDHRETAISEFSVSTNQSIIFSLSYSNQAPAVLPEVKTTGMSRMATTIHYWKEWINKCKYSGLYKDEVRRSALTLKLLTHAPTGAIIAAPTTSLPEEIGGIRNWDYRYCWLRDASFTINVLIALGYDQEAHAYMNWILHATQLTRPKLQVVYSVYGHTSLKEKSLDWMSGYQNSKPVRIGNDADVQFQLDLYGEVADALYVYSKLIKNFDRATKKFILDIGEAICELWDQPDNGIWEVRSSLIHHTHSKAMAWVGLDRIIKLTQQYEWKGVPVKKYQDVADRIRAGIENFGYNSQLNSYTREFNGKSLDASLLTLSLTGYCDANSTRMKLTVQRICEGLAKDKLLFRYLHTNDGLPGDEGSFGICNFWLSENFAKSGNLPKAMDVFETMLKYASPTGLFSEEIDLHRHEPIGNYPQGFTHIGLINAALSIYNASKKGGRSEL